MHVFIVNYLTSIEQRRLLLNKFNFIDAQHKNLVTKVESCTRAIITQNSVYLKYEVVYTRKKGK